MPTVKSSEPVPERDWRAQKKAMTRRRLQQRAMELFLQKGFEATTVEEISAAAGVSHMTFFRYFPTKEDVVGFDDYDEQFAELIRGRPADEPALEKVWHAVVQSVTNISPDERDTMLARMRLVMATPALRARTWEHQHSDEEVISRALLTFPNQPRDALRTQVIAATCLTALNTAVQQWAQSNGDADLRDLVDNAFEVLRHQFRSIEEWNTAAG
jgi:AcrR family transcriptional regulator